MKFAKRFVTFALFIMFATMPHQAGAATTDYTVKAAVLDAQAVMSKSKAAKSLVQKINKISEGLYKEMAEREAEFKKLGDELAKKKGAISDSEFEKEVEKFHKQVADVQQNIKQKKTKLEQAHAEAIGEIHNHTIELVKKLSQKYNFNLTIPSSQIIYFEPKLDITQEIIKMLDEKVKEVSLKY